MKSFSGTPSQKVYAPNNSILTASKKVQLLCCTAFLVTASYDKHAHSSEVATLFYPDNVIRENLKIFTLPSILTFYETTI